jgi:predicted nucleic acid-binding protein
VTSSRAQILDACVLINLLASGEIEGILRASALDSLICTAVEGESIYLRTEDPKVTLEPIDLRPLIDSGLLTVCHIEGSNEAELYVDYASALDDGEAMSLAIALSRGFDLATDERKARRLFLESGAEPQRLISTSELIRRWAEAESVPTQGLKAVLLQVEKRARYQPSVSDSNYQWWVDAIRH